MSRRSLVRLLLLPLGIAVVLTAMNNCDHVQLSLNPPISPSSILGKEVQEICAVPPTNSQRLTKVMFLVDMSNSNLIGNIGEGIPTDPDKSFRFNTINNFVNLESANSNISYGMIAFQGTTAVPLLKDGNGNAIFGNATQMASALTTFQSMTDGGDTPYKAAMTMASQTIGTDRLAMIANNQSASYTVVLISDGVPTDYGNPISSSQIDSDIQSLITAGGGATLSTVYYGPWLQQQDFAAGALLENMADQGDGNFTNTNISGRSIPVSQILAYNETSAWKITQFMVTNLNSAPCDDGSMGSDSDADGLCDQDEIAYNTVLAGDPTIGPLMNGNTFSPTQRNSFGNVYNDYINYRNLRFGEQIDTGCLVQSSSSADLLNDCEKTYVRNLSPVGPTSAWTAAMGFNADPFNFDSDGDGFTDFIELTFTRTLSAALDFTSNTQQVQGMSMQKILLAHLHPNNPNAGTPYDGVFQFTHVNNQGQNCYSYSQSVLPLVHTLEVDLANVPGFPQLAHKTDENVILIYYIQHPENDPYGPGELHYSYQKFSYGTMGISLDLNTSGYNVYSPVNARVQQGNSAN